MPFPGCQIDNKISTPAVCTRTCFQTNLPFVSNRKGDDRRSVPGEKVLSSALDLVVP